MHPTSFLIRQNGTYTDTVDKKEINNLKTLIESVKSKNVHITSFSKLAGNRIEYEPIREIRLITPS